MNNKNPTAIYKVSVYVFSELSLDSIPAYNKILQIMPRDAYSVLKEAVVTKLTKEEMIEELGTADYFRNIA